MIEKPKNLLIFDCDGVLVDSEIITTTSFVEQLDDVGYPITIEDSIKRFTGRSAQSIYKEINDEQGIYLSAPMIDKMQKKVHEILHQEIVPIPGIPELLSGLKGDNAFCVASSGTIDKIEKSLNKTHLNEHFAPNQIFSAQHVVKGKPAPDLFLHAAQQMGYKPQNCIVIEDSPAGIEAALAASMAVIGFLGGSHTNYDWYQNRIKSYSIPVAYTSEEIAHLIKEIKK